jgi:hypothetical protein
VVDGLVDSGALLRTGHRVRLAEHGQHPDELMRARVAALLATLTAAGATPVSADGVAARLGIPPPLLDQLRAAGEVIGLGPRIDLTRESWARISGRLDQLAGRGGPTVAGIRDDLETARRFAEAFLRHWNRARMKDRGGAP